jgi:hypothetical protein
LSKVAIQGDSSGSGTFTIASPNSNSNYTLTLPANTGTILTTASDGQAIPKAALPTGSVLQVVHATHSTEVSNGVQDQEYFVYQATITPLFSTSKLLAIATVGGIDNASSGRMSGRIRWNTTSGGTSGTEIAGQTQVAQNTGGTTGLSAMAMSGLSAAVGSTSTAYVKVTMTHGDAGGTTYVCRYGSQSQLLVMEIAA